MDYPFTRQQRRGDLRLKVTRDGSGLIKEFSSSSETPMRKRSKANPGKIGLRVTRGNGEKLLKEFYSAIRNSETKRRSGNSGKIGLRLTKKSPKEHHVDYFGRI